MLSVEGRHPHPSARAHSHNRLEGHFPCEGPREVIPTYIIYIYIYTHYTYTCVCVCVCVHAYIMRKHHSVSASRAAWNPG